MMRLSKILFIVSMLVSFLDYPYISVGPLHLKMDYLVFPFYLFLMVYLKKFAIDRSLLTYSALLIVCVLPSVIWSTAVPVSLSFLLGLVICLIVMWSTYELTKRLGQDSIRIMIYFYRATILLTVPLVVLGLQPQSHRGSFTLYEPSYWAIALIPYDCIVFYRLLDRKQEKVLVDLMFILAAIILSQSASMVIWCVLSLLLLAVMMNRLHLKVVFLAAVCTALFLFGLYRLNDRTATLFDSIAAVSGWDNIFLLIAFVGGNRLQRAYEGYQAVLQHPFLGVGLGALVNYTSTHFNPNDFTVLGSSASDFDTNGPVTNMFLELWAESGIFGIASFLLLLRLVFKRTNTPEMQAFRVALWVTMLSLMIESSYLRPYMWLLLGVSLGYREVCELEHQSK